MVPGITPQLANNQMAQSGNSAGAITVISGGVDNLRTMLEYAKGSPETYGQGITTGVGSISKMLNSNISASVGPVGSVSLGVMPIAILAGVYLLWRRFKR